MTKIVTKPDAPQVPDAPNNSPSPRLVAMFVLAVLAVVIGGLWLLEATLVVAVTLIAVLALALLLGTPQHVPETVSKISEWFRPGA